MADDKSTATAEDTKTDESAPEDPAMAEFLRQKREDGGQSDGDKGNDKGDDKEAAASDDSKSDEGADSSEQGDDSEDGGSDDSAESEADDAGDSKADDASTATKEQKRLGYQLRQIRGNDPFVARARKALTDDYVNAEGITDDQREIRQMKADNYIEKLERQRAQLTVDAEQVAQEFDFFNPNDKEHFDKPLYDRALARFSRDSLQMSDPDDNGKQEIIGYKTRLLDYMREEADIVLASRGQSDSKPADTKPADKGKPKGKPADDGKAAAQMDAASEDPGGASTTKADSAEEEKDPMMKAFLAGMDSV